MPLLTLVPSSDDTDVADQPTNDQDSPQAETATDPWNLPVQSDRFWIYEAKIRSCEITPHFRDRGRCGTCGDVIADKGSGFCSDDCARTFMVNHNWSLARFAALHRDDHTCVRCGHHPEPDERAQELVVRHIEKPIQERGLRGTRTRARGCHQHLTNLETLCRECDSAAEREEQAAAVPPIAAPAEIEPPATTAIQPQDLEPGLCNPSRGIDPEFWFEAINRRQAPKICAGCPVLLKCAQYALEMGVTDGVFAGVSLPGKRKGPALTKKREVLQGMLDQARARQHALAARDVDQHATATTCGGQRELERAGA